MIQYLYTNDSYIHEQSGIILIAHDTMEIESKRSETYSMFFAFTLSLLSAAVRDERFCTERASISPGLRDRHGHRLLCLMSTGRNNGFTLLEPQSHYGDKPVKFQVVCPKTGLRF